MNPALAACQLINVSRDGEQPGLWEAQEDVTLVLPKAVVSARLLCLSVCMWKHQHAGGKIDNAACAPAHSSETPTSHIFTITMHSQDAEGKPLSPDARRKWCDTPANLAGVMLDPAYVYTIHVWQQYASLGDYRLCLVSIMKDSVYCFFPQVQR